MTLGRTIPALPVRDAAKAVAHYRDRLRFEVLHHDGGFAVLQRDDARLHLWEASDTSWQDRATPERPVCSGADFDSLFTRDKPVIFAYHGYPWLIHRLTYRRANHHHLHVRGYMEEGTTTTPFDLVMLNDLDRFHLVIDVIDRVPGLATRAAVVRQHMVDERLRHRAYTRAVGDDPPSVRDWVLPEG